MCTRLGIINAFQWFSAKDGFCAHNKDLQYCPVPVFGQRSYATDGEHRFQHNIILLY